MSLLTCYFPDSVCNANMDGRDIVCVMPTGEYIVVCHEVVFILCVEAGGNL